MIAAEGTPYFPNNAPMVAILLDAKADINAQDARGRGALYRAAAEGKIEATRLFREVRKVRQPEAHAFSEDVYDPILINSQDQLLGRVPAHLQNSVRPCHRIPPHEDMHLLSDSMAIRSSSIRVVDFVKQ